MQKIKGTVITAPQSVSGQIKPTVAAAANAYEEGFAEGHKEGYTEGETKGEAQGYNRGYGEGYADGQEIFMHIYSLNSAFEQVTFPENYKLVLNVPNCLTFNRVAIMAKNLKEVKIISDNESAKVSFMQAFYYNTFITTLDLTEFKPLINSCQLFLTGTGRLTEVKGELDLSISTNNVGFSEMHELVEIRFKPSSIYYSINPKSSPKLSDTSIQSIIDGLADLTGGTAQTLSLHSTVLAKLTTEQFTQMENKNWNVG